jgi:lipopolysaccharide export system protein LptC
MMNSLRRAIDRLALYLPAILMAIFALGSWWLVRSLPTFFNEAAPKTIRQEPDYYLNGFSVKSFDSNGRLVRELSGAHAEHYPDTDTLDIRKVQLRGQNPEGQRINALADHALAKGDGSLITLLGNVQITQSPNASKGSQTPTVLRSQEIKAYLKEERLVSHQSTEIRRGSDVFTAEAMQLNSKTGEYELSGKVRGVVHPNTR